MRRAPFIICAASMTLPFAGFAVAQVQRPELLASADPGISGQERVELTALITESRDVLLSTDFRSNLLAFRNMNAVGADISQVWISAASQYVTVTVLADWLTAAANRNRYRFSHVQATGNATYDEVFTGSDPIDWSRPLIQIGRRHLGRYRSGNEVERSCAINTLAHELSHAFSTNASTYSQLIKDAGNDQAPAAATMVAGYLVGSVAQCTRLQQTGRIPASGVAACVRVFGQRQFNNGRCDDFAAGVPVQ